jgi:hypothetical protein
MAREPQQVSYKPVVSEVPVLSAQDNKTASVVAADFDFVDSCIRCILQFGILHM